MEKKQMKKKCCKVVYKRNKQTWAITSGKHFLTSTKFKKIQTLFYISFLLYLSSQEAQDSDDDTSSSQSTNTESYQPSSSSGASALVSKKHCIIIWLERYLIRTSCQMVMYVKGAQCVRGTFRANDIYMVFCLAYATFIGLFDKQGSAIISVWCATGIVSVICAWGNE
ncbi:hypothetical protein BDB00DRAFT_484467 [Zychaea mexicana]|uniref:uncharacterized protein n=1 Tax=Zychaea mexicana TaxID=64656 RepID=UPI0022FDD1DF|nr:uncharacterized protein BDB00DRAFT_484467 [Zychaea mexicana]KAI9491489.1 hypothetical protein BDB00DRAFT_484467 [Zychaea mexicana]